MKKITVFESSIIGLLIGVVVAAYLTFVTSVDGFISTPLSVLSWKPLLVMIEIPEKYLLVTSFIFFVAVYAVYGCIVGILFKKKTQLGIVALVVLVGVSVWSVFGQKNAPLPLPSIPHGFATAAVIDRTPKPPKPYFGIEAFGDLNGDAKDDVAFVITRNDEDKEAAMYYLSSALGVDGGHKGTNLIYLGEKMQPKTLVIVKGVITITYDEVLRYAQVIEGKLLEIQAPAVATTTITTATTTPEL